MGHHTSVQTAHDPVALDRLGKLSARANGCLDRGEYAQSTALFERAIELARSIFFDAPHELLPLLNNRAVVGKYRGDFDASQACYLEALDIAHRHFGERHVEIATLYHNLGGLAHARGDFIEGERLAYIGVHMREALLGAEHPHCVADRVAWAALLEGLGRQDEAETIYRAAIDYFGALGEDLEVAVNLNNLAGICAARQDLTQAEDCYRRALALKESKLGLAHPDVALTLNNLGLLRKKRGDLVEARALYRRAIVIFKATLQPHHPRLLTCIANLARIDPLAV